MDLDRLMKDYDLDLMVRNMNKLKVLEVASMISSGISCRDACKECRLSAQTLSRTYGDKSLYYATKSNYTYTNPSKGKKRPKVSNTPKKGTRRVTAGGDDIEDKPSISSQELRNLITSSSKK
jgi:hypothetical protein